ncbi:hypothetical protein KSP39_PZI003621 [Platanthera zijinensis]|uniref:Mitochondrial protein n=1 Tax=Platanthera zijinensis TaxID=2320716 RepID=A0AAP0BW22_9ASPA
MILTENDNEEVERKKNESLISQKAYTERIVERFDMKEGKNSSTPLEVGLKLHQDEGMVLPKPKPFRDLVWSLIYLTITRLDISLAVGRVNRYMQEHRTSHLDAAKGILKYVRTTLDMGLLYERDTCFNLHQFTDANYGGDVDDRRSTSSASFYHLRKTPTSASIIDSTCCRSVPRVAVSRFRFLFLQESRLFSKSLHSVFLFPLAGKDGLQSTRYETKETANR